MTDQDTTVSGRRLLTRRNMLIGSGGAVVAAGLATAGVTLLSKPPPRARLVWRYQGGGRYRIGNDFAGAGPPRLALSGGRIFASDAFGSVVALRASDGTVLWQRAVTIASAPVVAGSAVYVSDAGGTVYALRAADGTQLWQARVNAPGDTADDNPPQLCAADGVVYAMRNSVFALRASDGHVLWTAPAGNDGYGPLAADAARVYVGDLLAGLHALSARDGSAAWLFHDRARGANPAPLTPVAAGPVVYAEDGTGSVYALRAGDGSEIWRYRGSLESNDSSFGSAHPSPAAGTVLITAVSHGILALRPKDGSLQWRAAPPGPLEPDVTSTSSPGLGAGLACVSYPETGARAVRISDGALLWDYAYSRFGINTPAVGPDGTVYLTNEFQPLTISALRG